MRETAYLNGTRHCRLHEAFPNHRDTREIRTSPSQFVQYVVKLGCRWQTDQKARDLPDNPEPRCPCLLLLHNSSSMNGNPLCSSFAHHLVGQPERHHG